MILTVDMVTKLCGAKVFELTYCGHWHLSGVHLHCKDNAADLASDASVFLESHCVKRTLSQKHRWLTGSWFCFYRTKPSCVAAIFILTQF